MAILIKCDVCDKLYDMGSWQGLNAVIPNRMLAYQIDEDDEETHEYNICSWECVRYLAAAQLGEPQPHEEESDTPAESVVKPKFFSDEKHGEINVDWGNNPPERRNQSTEEVFPAGPGALDFQVDHQPPVKLRRKQ